MSEPRDTVDLAHYLADPARVFDAPADLVPALLAEVDDFEARLHKVIGGRVATVKACLVARLTEVVRVSALAPPLTAKEAAQRLNVGVDWVRDHGPELKEVRLSAGTVRYDPEAVERLRKAGR